MVSRIETHIVSHFRADRARQLDIVLEAILGWKNCIANVVITSNNNEYEKTGLMGRFTERFTQAGHSLSLNVVSDLTNPRMLTWAHKRFIEPWLQDASPKEDYFVYIEDDIEVTYDNLRYFMRNLKIVEKRGLIPGFLRYEKKDGERRLVDLVAPEFWNRDRSLTIDGQLFHACVNPYWAGFILDRDLAREYVASRSFSPTDSEFAPWNIQERAAMGLTFERPDARLKSRVVIPMVDGAPDPACLVWHCSDSYTADDHPLIGRLTIERAFQREGLGHFVLRKLRSASSKLMGKR